MLSERGLYFFRYLSHTYIFMICSLLLSVMKQQVCMHNEEERYVRVYSEVSTNESTGVEYPLYNFIDHFKVKRFPL